MTAAGVIAYGSIVTLTGINGVFQPRDSTLTTVIVIALGIAVMLIGWYGG